jgi:hypothetical protein
MAEPDSTTDKSADAPQGGPGASIAAPGAGLSARPSSGKARVAEATDATAPIAIDPESIVETSKEEAASAADGELRSKSTPSFTELAAKASDEIAARIVAKANDPLAGMPASDVATRAARSSGSVPVAPAASASDTRPLAAYELLARSARLADLVALTSRIVTDAARARTADWAFASKVSAAADEAKLVRDDADTRFGNAFDVLATGGEGTAERALAAALWAHAVAESPRSRTEDEDRLAGDILWLATHTAFDATPLLDRALGDEAADLWTAIADRVRRIERGRGGALGRGEAVVACAALAASGSAKAKRLCTDLSNEVKDPVLLRVLATGESSTPEEVRLEGELLPAPRGPIATTVLAFTGLLFVMHAVRLFARVALAYRRPAEVSLTESGVRVKTRTEMLGRTLREREHVVPRTGLVRVVREVRFPRAAFYAGLFALALGSWLGVRAFVDGVRAASPSLLVVGLVIVAVGIGADFVLGTLLPGARGRCRVAFVPRTGPVLCVGDVDARRADDALARSLARS